MKHLVGFVLFGAAMGFAGTSMAQYNGSLYGPINVDDGSGVSGLAASTATPTTNGNIRYQWRVLPSSSGNDRWMGFEWDSRSRQFAFYGNPTFTASDDVTISSAMDIGGSAYGWGAIGNFRLNGSESTKRLIFNISDTSTTLSTAPGNDVIQFALTEINHANALVAMNNYNGAPGTHGTSGMAVARSGNTLTLSMTNTAENSGSNEEIWWQWTHDNWTTKNFIEDTAIAANETTTINLSSSSPVLREGDTLRFNVGTFGPLDLTTISASSGGTLNFDVAAINKSGVVSTGPIADDDTAAPVPSAFSVSAQTDGSIVSGGYTISGTLTDAGSGVNNNGVTVTTDNFSPNFDILNNAGTELSANNLFTTRPADGANGTVSAAAPTITAGTSIDLGTYKIRVSATDNDEDPSTASNDRTALVDNQVTTFTVTDDDTTGPDVTAPTGNSEDLEGFNYLDTSLASGLALSFEIMDNQSGVDASAPKYGLARGGVAVTTGSLTPNFANGGAMGGPGNLTATIAAGHVQTVGSYTLYVTNKNYDVDRGTADQTEVVNTYSFTVYANTPVITVQAGTLAFGSQVVNTTSSEQSYTVSGINLGSDPIVITAPSGFQVSTTSGSGFGSSLNLTPSGGTVGNTTIYVRFVPNNVAGFSANITHTHTSAPQQDKAVTGTGTAPNNPAAFSATGGSLQNTLTFTLNAQSKPVTIVRNTSGSFTTPSGAPPAPGNAFAGGTVVYNGSSSPQNDTGLAAGTLYYYRAFSYDSVNGNFYSAGLDANATTIPAAPTTAAASGVGYTSFTANWNASSGATGYRLDVSYYPDFSAMLSGYSDLTVAGTSQSVSIPGTDNKIGQYYYRVRAVNGSGTSGNSDTRSVGTSIPQAVNGGGTPPAATIVAPGTIYVGDTGTFAVKAWATLAGNFARHRVVIDTDANLIAGGVRGSFTAFDNVEYSSATSPQFTSAGTWYWGMQFDYGDPYGTNVWMVRNNADWTDMYYSGTNGNLTVTVTALGDPTGVSATQDGTLPAERIDLAWTRWNSRNVMIVRSTDASFTAPTPGAAYTVGNTIGGDTVIYNGSGTSFEDTGLSASTTYYYKFYSENFSYYSTGAEANQTTAAAATPSAPVATAASAQTATGFTANWNASVGATSYRLDISSNATFTAIHPSYNDLNVGNVTTYAVSGLVVGQYYYRVRAVNGGGASDNSNTIETGTTIGQSRNKNGVSPPYYKNIANVDQGTIYVGDTITVGADLWGQFNSQNGAGRAVIHTTTTIQSGLYGSWGSADSVEYTEAVTPKFTSAGTWYWGIQMSYGTAGTNFWHVKNDNNWTPQHYAGTNGSIAVTVTALSDPTGPSATANGQNQIDLAWTKWNNRDVMIVRSTDNSFGTPNPNTVYLVGQTISGDTVVYKGNGTSFNSTGLGAGTTYYYKLYSENYGYYSAGTVVNATTDGTAPDAPTASAASSVLTTSFSANWSASAGATGYRLDVATDIGFSSFVSGYNNLNVNNVTTYSVSGLTGGNTYYYRVRAYNGAGTSGSSSTITVVTPSTTTVEIEEIQESTPTVGIVTWAATVGATYDVYYSDDDGVTWQFDATVTANSNPETELIVEDDKRHFKVVVAGQSPAASPSPAWGVIERTIPEGYSLGAPPLDLTDLTLAGAFGDSLKTGLANGSQVYFRESNGSWTTRTLTGGAWDANYTLVEGQGYYIYNAGSAVTQRYDGPVGNNGVGSRTISTGWNIIGPSQGKSRTFSQVTSALSGTPAGGWEESTADIIVIDEGNGNFRRIMKYNGTPSWLDLKSFSTPNVTIQPGQGIYYEKKSGSGVSAINF